MGNPAIKIENLSKQYRLGTIGTGTLRNDLKRWWHKSRGKEDPFLKIGESNDRGVTPSEINKRASFVKKLTRYMKELSMMEDAPT